MLISEHPLVSTAYAQFLAAVKRLDKSVRGTNVALVGRRVTWKRRGKPVDGEIVLLCEHMPWRVGVKADANGSAQEWLNIDQVSLL